MEQRGGIDGPAEADGVMEAEVVSDRTDRSDPTDPSDPSDLPFFPSRKNVNNCSLFDSFFAVYTANFEKAGNFLKAHRIFLFIFS